MGLKILENQIEILVKEQEAYIGIEFNNSYSKVLELSKGIAELVDLKHKIEKERERVLYPYNIGHETGIIAGISGITSKTTNCDENNITPILKEDHEIDNFIEYLNKEENELKKFIFGIESKGDKATIGEQSIQYEAKEAIAIIRQFKQRIKSFKDCKRKIKKHRGR